MLHARDPDQLQSGGDSELRQYTRKQVQTITRRSCSQALTQGAIACGPSGFADARIDQARFDAIYRRVANDVAPA